jgi:RNA polymerase sigma-70 factor (ECF subfamily)
LGATVSTMRDNGFLPGAGRMAGVGDGQVMAAERGTDKELVRQVQKGDKRAFDLLVLRHQHKVAGLVARYIRDADAVRDVVQEVFIKAFRAVPRFRGDSAFYTWLYRIAVNTSKNWLVSRQHQPMLPLDNDDGEELPLERLRDIDDPESQLRRDELERIIHEVIDGLPQELRSAVTLREYDGLSYEEIAEIMDCPVGTVRSRIFRAREAIDERVRPLLEHT